MRLWYLVAWLRQIVWPLMIVDRSCEKVISISKVFLVVMLILLFADHSRHWSASSLSICSLKRSISLLFGVCSLFSHCGIGSLIWKSLTMTRNRSTAKLVHWGMPLFGCTQVNSLHFSWQKAVYTKGKGIINAHHNNLFQLVVGWKAPCRMYACWNMSSRKTLQQLALSQFS